MHQISDIDLQTIVSPSLNETAVEEIVAKQSGMKNVKVTEIDISDAVIKGDAYLSIVNRIIIKAEGYSERGEKKDVNVPIIVKSLPRNIGRRKTFRSTDFFENETIFYEKVWPTLQKFQATRNVGTPYDNIPALLGAWRDGESDYIALEDMAYKGFQIAARNENIDYRHAATIMTLFGRFHALSYAFKQYDINGFEEAALELKETYFAEKYRDWFLKYQKNLIAITRDAVEKELHSSYLEKFDTFFNKDVFGLLCEISQVKGSLSVITHGDAWLPNFLFKYDSDGRLLQAVMVDFQLTRYTTCVNDVVFFLYVCIDEEMRNKHWEDLIIEYHNAFTSFVTDLGADPKAITMDALKKEIKQYACFGVGMGIEAIILSLLDEEQVSDLDDIEGEEAVPIESVCDLQTLKTLEKRSRLADVVRHAIDHGFI